MFRMERKQRKSKKRIKTRVSVRFEMPPYHACVSSLAWKRKTERRMENKEKTKQAAAV